MAEERQNNSSQVDEPQYGRGGSETTTHDLPRTQSGGQTNGPTGQDPAGINQFHDSAAEVPKK